jgi:8-oxo-dGTP pyrophosphatase MutT (NUDIX family)
MPKHNSLGIVQHEASSRRTDYLYRISIKGLIRNQNGEVLVVKETGRDRWDLPGGGMDHNESIKLAIARELKEEVNLDGDFTYKVISVDDPAYLEALDFWQVRLIFEVTPADQAKFSAGEDGDQVAFMDPSVFRNSELEVERRIYKYASLLSVGVND